MAVLCKNCGEELLGSVNRCWRCGTNFAGAASDGRPPQSFGQLPLSHVRQSRRGGVAEVVVLEDEEAAIASPPEPPVVAEAVVATEFIAPQRNASAAGGAYGALALGMIGIGVSFFTAGSVLMAVIGVGVGIWGLYSERRIVAMIGILLCCIALAIGGYKAGVYFQEYLEDRRYQEEGMEDLLPQEEGI